MTNEEVSYTITKLPCGHFEWHVEIVGNNDDEEANTWYSGRACWGAEVESREEAEESALSKFDELVNKNAR